MVTYLNIPKFIAVVKVFISMQIKVVLININKNMNFISF